MQPEFDTPEQLVQDFLNNPQRQTGAGGVVVQMTYPHLVALVRSAYRTGIQDEKTRRGSVTPLVPTTDGSSRFANLELRERDEEDV